MQTQTYMLPRFQENQPVCFPPQTLVPIKKETTTALTAMRSYSYDGAIGDMLSGLKLSGKEDDLDAEAAQMNQEIRKIQRETARLVSKIFVELGKGIGSQEREKEVLESENRRLKIEIAQLHKRHRKELHEAVSSYKEKRDMIYNKSRELCKKIDVVMQECQKIVKLREDLWNCLPTPSLTIEEQVLMKCGHKWHEDCSRNLKELSEYLSRCKFSVNFIHVDLSSVYRQLYINQDKVFGDPAETITPSKEINIPASLSNALQVRLTNPVIRDLTQDVMDEYDAVKQAVAPLRAVNNGLVDKIEKMIKVHRSNMEAPVLQNDTKIYKLELTLFQGMYDPISNTYPSWQYPAGQSAQFLVKFGAVQDAFRDIILSLKVLAGE